MTIDILDYVRSVIADAVFNNIRIFAMLIELICQYQFPRLKMK